MSEAPLLPEQLPKFRIKGRSLTFYHADGTSFKIPRFNTYVRMLSLPSQMCPLMPALENCEYNSWAKELHLGKESLR
jgi:hypothetical protein